jgi:hypothetical protein
VATRCVTVTDGDYYTASLPGVVVCHPSWWTALVLGGVGGGTASFPFFEVRWPCELAT